MLKINSIFSLLSPVTNFSTPAYLRGLHSGVCQHHLGRLVVTIHHLGHRIVDHFPHHVGKNQWTTPHSHQHKVSYQNLKV